MKVLITGALGFIATNLIFQAKKKFPDWELSGIDSKISLSNNEKHTDKLCDHHFFSLENTSKLDEALQDVDIVIHLAASGNVIESIEDPIQNFNLNAYATLILLERMRINKVFNIVFSSTGGALMGNTAPPVNENSKPAPISPYGASKLACEGYISAYCKSFDFNSTILRFGNVYGPYSKHKKGVINKWIINALNNRAINIFGNGSASRDYIHVEDLCQGILLAAERLLSKQTNGLETFHLANQKEVTLNSLLKSIESAHGQKILTNYLPERSGEVSRNYADISKARKFLGFSPSIKLSEGIQQLYDWLKHAEDSADSSS